MRFTHLNRTWLFASVAVGALAACAGSANAGSLEVREQSSFFQGTSFAGTAAGGSSLSSVFWNPAASSFVGAGVTTDSSYSLILPSTELTITEIGAPGPGAIPAGTPGSHTDIGRDAIVPASYLAWRYNEKTVFALSMNSPYGLTTKPDNPNWLGNPLGTTGKVFSLNLTPSVSYQITPQISVGAGVQFQFVELKKFKASPADGVVANLEGEDLSVGGVVGINITPFRGTSIGLGYRSRVEHDMEGSFAVNGTSLASTEFGITTPDKVTLSLRQDLTPAARLLATVEWTNWSIVDRSPVFAAGGPFDPDGPGPSGDLALDFGYEDGWLYALGGEYDVSDKLTLRAGVAYEVSPADDAESRLTQLPDNDRIWASLGATYDWSDSISVNLGYSYVHVEEGTFERHPSSSPVPVFTGDVDASAHILALGLTMKLDPLDAPLK